MDFSEACRFLWTCRACDWTPQKLLDSYQARVLTLLEQDESGKPAARKRQGEFLAAAAFGCAAFPRAAAQQPQLAFLLVMVASKRPQMLSGRQLAGMSWRGASQHCENPALLP